MDRITPHGSSQRAGGVTMITYQKQGKRIAVKLDGKVTGYIRKVETQYAYFVKKGNYAGDLLGSIAAVKRSIEGREV